MTRTSPDDWFLPPGAGLPSPHFTSDNEVVGLVDGQEYMSHLSKRLAKLKRGDDLMLSGWRVSPEVLLEPLATPPPPPVSVMVRSLIQDGVTVRALVWYPPGTIKVGHPSGIGWIVDSQKHPGDNLTFVKEVISASLSAKSAGTGILDERLVSKVSSHHQKFIVGRSAEGPWAYVGGIDLCVDRWDTAAHDSPPQRQRELVDGWHDVQCFVRGSAVAQIWMNFKQRWDDRTPPARVPSPIPIVTPAPISSAPPSTSPAGRQHVQVLRTLACRNVYPFSPRGEQTARLGLERAIERAQHYIYLEEQYLWPCGMVDVLQKALARNRRLRFIVVLARDYDIPLIGGLHYSMRDEAVRKISGGRSGQVLVYHLEQLHTKRPIYVHSKLMIVDDCFVGVGSTNFNKRSTTTDSELHLGVVDGATEAGVMDGRPVTVCTFAKELRVKLWQEHLGIGDRSLVEDPIASLSLWPDWSKSSFRNPSRVHHVVCHHPRSDAATIADWIRVLRAVRDVLVPPPPWENVLDKAIGLIDDVPGSHDVVVSQVLIDGALGALAWVVKKLLRDYVMNVETTC